MNVRDLRESVIQPYEQRAMDDVLDDLLSGQQARATGTRLDLIDALNKHLDWDDLVEDYASFITVHDSELDGLRDRIKDRLRKRLAVALCGSEIVQSMALDLMSKDADDE